MVVAEIDPDSGAETEERIRADGGEAIWVDTDVTEAVTPGAESRTPGTQASILATDSAFDSMKSRRGST